MKVLGAEQTKAAIMGIADQAPNALQAALVEAAEPLRQRIAELVRRAPGAPDLADHIVIQVEDGAVAIGPSIDHRSDQPGRQFDEQGQMLEFGTRHMPAFPFMRPAFDGQSERSAEEAVKGAWRRLTERLP